MEKILGHIERINSIEAAAAARQSAFPTPSTKPTVAETIASGRALELVFEYIAPNLKVFAIGTALIFLFINFAFFRLTSILSREKPGKISPRQPPSKVEHPTHLLIVLGSGGHTAEMISMLRRLTSLPIQYTHRTYVVSSGDSFSSIKAAEFEADLLEPVSDSNSPSKNSNYDIVTVRRARNVHQTILTTPYTAGLCLWDCFKVLQGTHPDQGYGASQVTPDLILTNGPGTGVCVVLASIMLLFLGMSGSSTASEPYHSGGQMRTIFIESFARVRTLSLSGWILKPLVDRFVVQWDLLARKEGSERVEYVGILVE